MNAVDVDKLPATQYLVLELLAARHRLGETLWTFPSRLARPLRALEETGLISVIHGITPNTLRARLTHTGQAAALADGYVNPVAAKMIGAVEVGMRSASDQLAEPGTAEAVEQGRSVALAIPLVLAHIQGELERLIR